MATNKMRKSQPVAAHASESGSEEEQSSQGAEANMLKSAQNAVELNKKRRETKRKAIEGEHGKRVKEARDKIDQLFDARKCRVTKSQKALWQRLDDLNKRRQTLEGHILASMKSIENHTINMTKEMAAVCKGRTEEITGEGSY